MTLSKPPTPCNADAEAARSAAILSSYFSRALRPASSPDEVQPLRAGDELPEPLPCRASGAGVFLAGDEGGAASSPAEGAEPARVAGACATESGSRAEGPPPGHGGNLSGAEAHRPCAAPQRISPSTNSGAGGSADPASAG